MADKQLLKTQKFVNERGFAMVSLLLAISIFGIVASMALPAWNQMLKREREAELIFRGEQYARAILLYQRQQPGAYPPDIDTLVDGRFLRKRYRDPMMAEGQFRVVLQTQRDVIGVTGTLEAGSERVLEESADNDDGRNRNETDDVVSGGVLGGIVGVASRNTDISIRTYNGRTRYSEWEFVYTPDSQTVGQVNVQERTGAAQEDSAMDGMGRRGGSRLGTLGRSGGGQSSVR